MKINLKEIIFKFGDSVFYQDSPNTTDVAYTLDSVITIIEEVWNTCVDECKKAAEVKKPEKNTESMSYNNVSKNDYKFFDVDEDSIEQVKQMIL